MSKYVNLDKIKTIILREKIRVIEENGGDEFWIKAPDECVHYVNDMESILRLIDEVPAEDVISVKEVTEGIRKELDVWGCHWCERLKECDYTAGCGDKAEKKAYENMVRRWKHE